MVKKLKIITISIFMMTILTGCSSTINCTKQTKNGTAIINESYKIKFNDKKVNNLEYKREINVQKSGIDQLENILMGTKDEAKNFESINKGLKTSVNKKDNTITYSIIVPNEKVNKNLKGVEFNITDNKDKVIKTLEEIKYICK